MRVVYVGQVFDGSTARSRAEALRTLGHEVRLIDGTPPESGGRRILAGIRRRTGLGPVHLVSFALSRAIAQQAPDILWVDKGLNISRSVVKMARRAGAYAIHYSPDRHRIRSNMSIDLFRSMREYDLVVTTKRQDVGYLRSLGAKKVLRAWDGYDPSLHQPPSLEERDARVAERVLFIGAWEKERGDCIESLCRAKLPVTVVSHWPQFRTLAERYSNLDWRPSDVYGRGYAVLLGSAAICLGFLRKLACDQHTSRSIEIPASGGLLLAERTEEHAQLFREGEEAEFFGSQDECLAKCRVLLADPDRRARIAEAGMLRCQRAGYSWPLRMGGILAEAGLS